MIKLEQVDSITLEIDGEEVRVYRDEMLRNDELYNILTSYDQLQEDLKQLEYEREIRLHAQFSMRAKLQKSVHDYIMSKKNPVKNSEQ